MTDLGAPAGKVRNELRTLCCVENMNWARDKGRDRGYTIGYIRYNLSISINL